MQLPCPGQENELAVGREGQMGHKEDRGGSCMEIEPPPPSGPYGIHLRYIPHWRMLAKPPFDGPVDRARLGAGGLGDPAPFSAAPATRTSRRGPSTQRSTCTIKFKGQRATCPSPCCFPFVWFRCQNLSAQFYNELCRSHIMKG